ncbi:hypothetical protein SAMN05661080_02092 [Modestobacter sp. DSM 44400]|uniref:hypothetical protein n=1 Tax=Modestobacter sp. DSM 44400 TaxID=1550230 RepID=UPI00089A5F05|nr:hypothetical protein [Modestobacter sp. DSM 44400]SDY03281.1 hypothetical protein SAMN05661080_02092 [Modestobacter sp. DSM 44400]
MGWLVSVTGAVLVALVLRELFHTLWHPRGRGRFDQWVPRAVWRLSGRGGGSGGRSTRTGPLSLLLVVLSWVVLTSCAAPTPQSSSRARTRLRVRRCCSTSPPASPRPRST